MSATDRATTAETRGHIELGAGRAIALADGRIVEGERELSRLTSREIALVRYLHERAGKDVPRDELATSVLGQSPAVASRALDTAIARLRRKIERDPGAPRVLLTSHACGYRWRGEERSPSSAPPPPPRAPRVVLADRTVDLDARTVHHEDGRAWSLTPLEVELVSRLVQRGGRWIAAEDLWPETTSRARARSRIAKAMHRLRAKLEPPGEAASVVESRRGHGYRIDARIEREPFALGGEIVWSLARHAGQLLGLDDCVVYLRDGDALRQAAAWGPKSPAERMILDPIAIPIGAGIVGSAAASARPELVPDTRSDARYIFDHYAGRSELAVPVLEGDDVLGVIDSESARPAAYGARERDTLLSVASVLAASLRDAGMRG